MKKFSTSFSTLIASLLLLTVLMLCSEAQSQIVADAGGSYAVNSGESVVLNGIAYIPGANLREIGLALHNHHSAFKELPPAIISDGAGNPLYSWRVKLLPFLGEIALYNQFDLTKAWDDPVNLPLLDQMPDVFRRIGATENDNFTDFAGPLGPNVFWIGSDPIKFRDVLDGLSNTILLAETTQADIPWTAPVDVMMSTHPGIEDVDGFSSDLDNVIMILMGDGAVKFLKKDTPQSVIDALFTRNGMETIDLTTIVIDPGSIDTYEWDLDDDGVFESTGANPTFNATGLSTGSYPVHMRVTTTTGITAIVFTVVEVECSTSNIVPCGNNKIIVCHVPKGNPGNAHEICVSVKSANKHVAKHSLDYLGNCDCGTTNKLAKTNDAKVLVDVHNQLQGFPNPASHEIQVHLWSKKIESIEIQLFDLAGNLVNSIIQQTDKGENQFDIDVSNLNEGLYLLRMHSATRDDVLKIAKVRN